MGPDRARAVTIGHRRVPGPPSPLAGPRRLARIGALGGASMLLATGAHVAAGGRLPSLAVLLVTGFLVGLVATTLTARRCRLGRLVVALAIEQALLHLVFDATSMPAGCPGGMAGGHAAAMTGCLTGGQVASAGPDVGMLLAHGIATLATAWLLARGERLVWDLCERAVRAAGAAPTARVRRPRPGRAVPGPVLRSTHLAEAAEPRGPPAYAWSA